MIGVPTFFKRNGHIMQVKFWGTRGSFAKPGPATNRYGGNTSCVEVRSNSGTLFVIDCGTGAHGLGQHLVSEKFGAVNGHMLISHTHWDHIQGVPFFAPFFEIGNIWHIYGPRGLSENLRAALAGQMEYAYFPVTLEQFAAEIHYHGLVEGEFAIEDVKIRTLYLNHPALTLAYRFEADGVSLVYCCDHEPYSAIMASGDVALEGMDQRFVDFVAGADLVIHDAQYTAVEYSSKIGWGHSPVEYAVRVCLDGGVRRLVLSHHDPLRDDDAIDQILDGVRQRLREDGSLLEVVGAAEGLVLNLEGSTASLSAPAKHYYKADTAVDLSYLARPVLLLVDDNRVIELLREAVALEGLPYSVLSQSEDVYRSVREDIPSLVILGHNPPGMDGFDTARTIRLGDTSNRNQIPLVLVPDPGLSTDLENGINVDWLFTPFSLSYVRTKIRAWVLRTACRWESARLPANEAERIVALRELAILDTPTEERFDRLTRIAAAALDLPIALVSLVDSDRQWFKSCYGLETLETSRDVSFCAHVVHQKSEMVVHDTFLDDRFADNPLVLDGPRIRSYAGAPLLLDDGNCIGTFCVISTRPREFSDYELAMLRDLRDLALIEVKRGRT